MEQAINTFNNYVAQFDKSNQKVRLKIAHTYRVVNLAKDMSQRLGLTEEESQLMILIALLHDIGRFKQIEVQNSFLDDDFDHAFYGVRYLFKEDHIKEYTLNSYNYAIIAKAIYFHNKHVKELPKFPKNTDLFVKLIRDIDKIDIVNTQTQEYQIYFAKDDVPQSYYQAFFKKESIKRWGKRNPSKSFLTTCAFVYDLNFQESYELLEQLDYLPRFFAKAMVEDDSSVLFNDIKNKVYERVREKDVR